MTTYRCRKCPAQSNGAATYHPGTWACPKEGAYDVGKVTKYSERKTAAKRVLKGEATTTPASPPPGAAAPGAQPPAPAGLLPIEMGTKIAETVRRDNAEKKAEEDWTLPADSSETFFQTIRNVFRTFAHWCDDLLDAKHTPEGEIKDSIFDLNSHDLAGARGTFGRRFATKVVKGLGATTVEEGIATVDTLAFFMMFGSMILSIAGHIIKVAPDSKPLQKLRDKAKVAVEKRKAEAEEKRRVALEKEAVTTTGRMVAKGGAAGG